MTDPGRLSDLEIELRLSDWAEYLADENGDIDPGLWAEIDALLDERISRNVRENRSSPA